jgi:hypothetical protein
MSKKGSQAGNEKGKKRQTLTRSDLLPMTEARFQAVSLRHHLALAAMRSGAGSLDIAGELLKATYFAFFIGGFEADMRLLETCVAAELTIKASIAHAKMADEWRLDEKHAHFVEKMLCLHDAQLSRLPAGEINAAARRLTQLVDDGGMPDLAARYVRVLKQKVDGIKDRVQAKEEEPVLV